ncbi:MAG: heme-binding protein [Proteobacteria bacterium]|nr:heme-binding protein [Pseudomonadota bacterium]
MKKTKLFFLISLVFSISSCSQAPKNGYYRGYEIPSYNVTKKVGDVEFRVYQPQLIAEVEVAGDRKEAARKGFLILANYIFGENISAEKISMTSPVTQKEIAEKSEKISMTSPVNQIAIAEKKWLIQFKMPQKYDLQTLPKAKDERIKFKNVAERKTVSITFSGSWSDKKFSEKKHELEKFIKENNLKTKGEITLAYYDDPFTLPWNRRNEVIQEIK